MRQKSNKIFPDATKALKEKRPSSSLCLSFLAHCMSEDLLLRNQHGERSKNHHSGLPLSVRSYIRVLERVRAKTKEDLRVSKWALFPFFGNTHRPRAQGNRERRGKDAGTFQLRFSLLFLWGLGLGYMWILALV